MKEHKESDVLKLKAPVELWMFKCSIFFSTP